MEEVNDQIDRINLAVQQVMEGIANVSIENTRMSITNAYWLENSSQGSLDIPDGFEDRIEGLLQELDRTKMTLEDLWSERHRELVKVHFTKSELHHLLASLKSLLNGRDCTVKIGMETYQLSLSPSETLFDHRETTIIENSIMDCGHDILKIRKEIALDVEHKLQMKKNQYIEDAKASLESNLKEFDRLKQTYDEKIQDLVSFSNQLEKREKAIELKELKLQKENGGELPKNLEERLKALEEMCVGMDSEDQSRIALQIEQIKNKLTNMRVEKVISESKQTTSVLTRVVRAMEKEVSNDEKQRKKELEKFHEYHNRRPSEHERIGTSSLKKQEENFRVYMEKARMRLKKKEIEIAEKERSVEEKWMKVPGSKELIELMRSSLDKLNQLKEENERERELLEREKLDVVNLNEKIVKIWAGLENLKKTTGNEEFEKTRQQIHELNFDPKGLGFH